MSHHDLKTCIDDLDRQGELLRIKEEVDPYLEMAAIHRQKRRYIAIKTHVLWHYEKRAG